ncbi:homocysteine S-methyltransferase family protein [Paenarthrobacter sp. RAF9]
MPQNTTLSTYLAAGKDLVLDGALATELEAHGCDLEDALWSAKVLLEQPHLIKQVHRDYFDAGASVAITASYQATPQGFARRGLSVEESLELVALSVRLADEARQEYLAANPGSRPLLVAGSVGPYGAYLADGSEYRCVPLELVTPALESFQAVSDKPLVAYPNSGETYDAVTKTWGPAVGVQGSGTLAGAAADWHDRGARLIGGCCRTTPRDIEGLVANMTPREPA